MVFDAWATPLESVAINVAIDTSGEAIPLTKQTEDTVAWIMKWGAESVDENAKMVEKLERLDVELESASKIYSERFGQDYANIKGMIESIGYGMTEGLRSDIVDLQVMFPAIDEKLIFPELRVPELSDKDIIFFRSLQSRFLEKSPETQARMLWFFELVNDYVVSKSNDLTIRTNPLKNILFSIKDVSYKQWIAGIIECFEENESWMIALNDSIRSAEAPQVGLKQFIRKLFDTNSEVMEEEDHTFLQMLYTQWPDEEITNKPNTISKEDKTKRDQIAKKYVFDYSDRGVTSDNEKTAMIKFKTFVMLYKVK